MYFDDFINGLNILKEYYTDIECVLNNTITGKNYDCNCGNYEQFATDIPLIEDDIKRLIAYGWFQDVEGVSYENFTYKDYDSSKKWYAFI